MNKGYALCLNEWALDKEIKNELGLLLIISSLCAEKGYCWANNEYLANIFEVDESTISRKLKKLEKKKYIIVDYEKRGCEVISRKIRLTKMSTDELQKCQPTIDENVKENNIIINNTIINNTINMSSSIKKIINYLNQPDTEEPIRSFKSSASHTKILITARLNEGFTVDDFKDVIFLKYNQWVKKPYAFDNDKMSDNYYRPETLFCSKNFENYLQEYKKQPK